LLSKQVYAGLEAFLKERVIVPDVAASLNNLAGLYRSQGKCAEGAPLYQRSLAIWEKALGPDHPDARLVRSNLDALS
jgi:hypothetical protein